VALRLALRDVPTKDFIRQELRALLDELDSARDGGAEPAVDSAP
jgi:hypothetical protein